MWFGGTDRKSAKTPFSDLSEQLQSIPVRNVHVRVAEDTDDTLVLAVDRTYSGIARVVVPILRLRRERRFFLAGVGLDVYRHVDGRQSVGDLIDWLAKKHALTFFESRALLLQYLQMLMERGLVVVAVPEMEDASG